ncbi:MAG: HlyD family efflux transporter periplasmic adaptor subunit [Pirellulaceae bacterium]
MKFTQRGPLCLAVLWSTALVVSTCSSAHGQSERGSYDQGSNNVVSNCLILWIDDPTLSASEAGLLLQVLDEGDRIRKGDVVAQIDDRVAQMQLQQAKLQLQVAEATATNRVPIDYAEATARVAEAEKGEAEAAIERAEKSISRAELRTYQLKADQAKLGVKQQEKTMQIDGLKANVEEQNVKAQLNEIQRRKVISPIDGMVAHTFCQEGEWMNPGDPVVKLIRLDRVRVEGYVNAGAWLPSELEGRRVSIAVPLPNGRELKLASTITYVSLDVEADNTFRVWADVDNPADKNSYLLRSGMAAEMIVEN